MEAIPSRDAHRCLSALQLISIASKAERTNNAWCTLDGITSYLTTRFWTATWLPLSLLQLLPLKLRLTIALISLFISNHLSASSPRPASDSDPNILLAALYVS